MRTRIFRDNEPVEMPGFLSATNSEAPGRRRPLIIGLAAAAVVLIVAAIGVLRGGTAAGSCGCVSQPAGQLRPLLNRRHQNRRPPSRKRLGSEAESRLPRLRDGKRNCRKRKSEGSRGKGQRAKTRRDPSNIGRRETSYGHGELRRVRTRGPGIRR